MNRLPQIALATIPLLLAPILLYSIAEGWLNFGGGEKDLLLLLPYLIWSLIYFVTALILILKNHQLLQWTLRSFITATVVLLLLGFSLFLIGWLGIA